MHTLSTHYVVNQLILHYAPGVPPQVLQLTYQLNIKVQQLLGEFDYYVLLLTSLAIVILLIFGSLALLLRTKRVRSTQPYPYLPPQKLARQHPKRMVNTPIAKANWAELQSASTRIRMGQLSN